MKRKPKTVAWYVYREPVSGWYTICRRGRAGNYALLSMAEWQHVGMKALRPGQKAKLKVTVEVVA